MHKSATKCNETLGKWCKNKHGALKIMDTLETYQPPAADLGTTTAISSRGASHGVRVARSVMPKAHVTPSMEATRPLVRLLNLLGQGELEEPNKYRNLADNWQQIKSRRR
jgi:hypothetical protein